MPGNDTTDVAMATGGTYSLATRGAKDVIDGAWPVGARYSIMSFDLPWD